MVGRPKRRSPEVQRCHRRLRTYFVVCGVCGVCTGVLVCVCMYVVRVQVCVYVGGRGMKGESRSCMCVYVCV